MHVYIQGTPEPDTNNFQLLQKLSAADDSPTELAEIVGKFGSSVGK